MLGTSCFASYAQWGTAPNKKPSSHYSCLKGQVATTATYHHPSWHFQSPITHHLTGHLKTLSPWLAALQQEIEVGMAAHWRVFFVMCLLPSVALIMQVWNSTLHQGSTSLVPTFLQCGAWTSLQATKPTVHLLLGVCLYNPEPCLNCSLHVW